MNEYSDKIEALASQLATALVREYLRFVTIYLGTNMNVGVHLVSHLPLHLLSTVQFVYLLKHVGIRFLEMCVIMCGGGLDDIHLYLFFF